MRIIVVVVTQTASTTASRALKTFVIHSKKPRKNITLSWSVYEEEVTYPSNTKFECGGLTICLAVRLLVVLCQPNLPLDRTAWIIIILSLSRAICLIEPCGDRSDLCFGMKEFNEALCSAFKQKPGAAIRSGLRIYLAKIAFTMDTSSPRTTPTSTQAYNSCVYVTSVRMRKVILFS